MTELSQVAAALHFFDRLLALFRHLLELRDEHQVEGVLSEMDARTARLNALAEEG